MAEPAAPPFFPAESAHEPPPPSRRPRHGACPSTTPESKFWRSFRNSQLASGLLHPVTHLDFSPAAPHDLAATFSANLAIYGGAPSPDLSHKPFSPLHHFDDVAYSPSFRCDGSLLAVGSHSGLIQVFDPHRARPPLRRLRAHTRPVRVVRYPRAADKAHLFSGGDDAVLNHWDVVSETPLLTIAAAHKDYIRAGAPSPVSAEVVATGSYDHTVRLWDVRAPGGGPVAAFNHGDPVECVLFLPSGGLLASAGGNVVKIWDVIGGGRMIHRIDCHNKTVTSVCLGRVGKADGGESRLLTASLDGYLKAFDYASFKITHSTRYPSMLLAAAFSPVGNVVVAGTSNGVIYIGKKKTTKEESQDVDGDFDGHIVERRRPALRPTYFRYFQRGQSEKPSATDVVVSRRGGAKAKQAEHDRLLKRFEHREALLCVLERKNPNTVVAVMQELVARRKLLAAVKGLDEEGLGLLLGFLHRNATMPRYARFLMGLTTMVLQMREEDIRASAELRTHARNIKRMVVEEIQIQRTLQEMQGMISPLLRIAGR